MTRNTCSKWNDVTSLLIKIDFGVRQGSALSPFLFAVYVDDMITRFYVSQRCFIALRADDILIFSPSLQELQNIVNTCELELLSIDMAINTKKSCTMCIEPRRDIKCGNITINITKIFPGLIVSSWLTSVRNSKGNIGSGQCLLPHCNTSRSRPRVSLPSSTFQADYGSIKDAGTWSSYRQGH